MTLPTYSTVPADNAAAEKARKHAPEILQAFASQLCSNISLEEAISQIFRFLARYIPVQHMLCMAMERKTHTIHVLVEYNTKPTPVLPQSIRVEKIIPWEKILQGGTDNTVIVEGDLSLYPEAQEYFHQLGMKPRSVMSHMLYEDQQEDRAITVLVVHDSPGIYTAEHATLLSILLPILGGLVRRFTQTTATPYLYVDERDNSLHSSEDLLRRCKGLTDVMHKIDAVANTQAIVLIQGASGTGKELVADALHALSTRKDAPFVKVNCGAIPDTLLGSELFGHEKGAFTGAQTARRGYFEQAQRGTIYLDEIGELSLSAQTHLLRVLETDTVRRLGGDKEIRLDARVIAATNRDLCQMVADGTFREDLWYRLNVYPLFVPPLNARREDIPTLVQYFYTQASRKMGIGKPPRLTLSSIADLQTRDWPGNVRQLRFAVERALIQGAAARLTVLRFETDEGNPQAGLPSLPDEQSSIEAALRRCKGKIQGPAGAAYLLGQSPSTLRNRMRRLGIPLPREKK